MRIVDAQVHIWASGPPSNPPHRQVEVFSKDSVLTEMDEATIDAAILHPPGWDPNGNDVAVDAARQHPDRFAILGHFPLDRPESRTLINHWKDRPGMVGLRFALLQPHQRVWWTDGTIDWLWPADLVALARYPNVAVKATGAPSYSSEPYPYRNIHPYLHQLYDAFGPERMFWGTDIPRMPCSWRLCVSMFTEELPWLSDRDKELTMGAALCTWLGWQPQPKL